MNRPVLPIRLMSVRGLIFILAIAAGSLHAQRPVPARKAAAAPVQPEPAAWELTFSDEFDGPLDLGKWILHDPPGTARARELQGYAPEAAQVWGGQLHLTASRGAVRYDGRDREYVSGVVSTFGIFSQAYGRFEIRCRIPAGAGLAPGFRLLPVPLAALPEIDGLLASGGEPTKVRFANHWGSEQTTRSFYDAYPAPDLSAGFHTIALEWDKGKIVWFVDGKETMRSSDGVPQQAMFLVLDLAVGGAVAGAPNKQTQLPATFDIDYVRVWKRRAEPKVE